jgi:hypothetical protein
MSVVQMADSHSDPRAIGHAKRDVVRSYCGGPIVANNGQLLGTVCHFDFEPQSEVLDLMLCCRKSDPPSRVLSLPEGTGWIDLPNALQAAFSSPGTANAI